MNKNKKTKGVINLFGLTPPEKVESLPREVLKWIQSLDLTYSIRNVKKDFNNGFLVAQILSRYYPVTNDINQNYKAIQMHQISNGYSMATRKDNWEQINKFIRKISEISTSINDIDTFIKNENGEILLFIISLYQELTKRRIPLLEGKVITTDIDNYNKSYLLKENGEIEKLKKTDIDNLSSNLMPNAQNQLPIQQQEPPTEQIEKKNDEFLNTQKTTNSILSRASQIVMKGDVKPMSLNPVQMEKGFKIKISEPKVYETITRTIYQPRQQNILDNINKNVPSKKSENDNFGDFNSLIQDDREVEKKTSTSTDNPFLTLDEPLKNKIKHDFVDDFNHIKIGKGNKFIYYFFKSVDDLSDNVFNFVLKYVLKIIEDFYNILSGKQVNDFVDIFLLMFDTYINLDNFDDESKKFSLMHDAMLNFFVKSLKNKNEEMFYIFKNIFIEKIFETINDKEYNSKLSYLCNILFTILQPSNEQQIDLFKMFKEKTNENEEIMYECFAILHDEFKTYTDGLIDGCLFYILNGLSNENPKIRYFSLEMLLHYSQINVNFVYNFANKLEKLSCKERDRENCLLIIKIVCQSLKAAYIKKTQPKDSKTQKFVEKDPNGDSEQQIYLNDIAFGNKAIKEIVNRFIGDHVFILLFTNSIYEYLYDNCELYEILLDALFQVNESILNFTFYEGNLDEKMKTKYECTIFRRPVNIEKINVWNTPMLLKAFDTLVAKNGENELTQKDYEFLRFIIKDGLDVNFSDIWKTSFNFSPLVIRGLLNYETVGKCIAILDAFLQCEPIQKFIFDEWYDNLSKTFNELINIESEDAEKCRNQILDILERWINEQKISQIVRDDIKKLLEIFPKEMKDKHHSNNINNDNQENEENENREE